jgi:hypothetical protein
MSAFEGNPEGICSGGVLLSLTQLGHGPSPRATPYALICPTDLPILAVLASPFKSKVRLQAENAVLRHQLIVVRRRLPGRVRLTNHDRWFLIQLYRWFPSILQVLTIMRPETLVRWHRAGFREVAPIGRATADRHGAARVDPADEHGESALGRATHSRRTAQARV